MSIMNRAQMNATDCINQKVPFLPTDPPQSNMCIEINKHEFHNKYWNINSIIFVRTWKPYINHNNLTQRSALQRPQPEATRTSTRNISSWASPRTSGRYISLINLTSSSTHVLGANKNFKRASCTAYSQNSGSESLKERSQKKKKRNAEENIWWSARKGCIQMASTKMKSVWH